MSAEELSTRDKIRTITTLAALVVVLVTCMASALVAALAYDPIVETFEDGSYVSESGSTGCLPGYPCND